MSINCNEMQNFSLLINNFKELNSALKHLTKFSKEYVKLINEFNVNLESLFNIHLKCYDKAKTFSGTLIKNVCKLINSQFESFKPLINSLNKKTKISEDLILEKENSIQKIQEHVSNSKKELENQTIQIKKYKTIFDELGNESEELIINYYISKKNPNNNNNNNKIFLKNNETNKNNNNSNNIYEERINQTLQKMKNSEKDYMKSVNNVNQYEENFLSTLHISNSNLIKFCKEYGEILKEISLEYLNHYKSYDTLIESELKNSIPFLTEFNIGEKFNEQLKGKSSICFPFQKIKVIPYTLKKIIKYNTYSNDLYKSKNEIGVNDVYEMVRKFYEYLRLRDENYNLEIEEEKIITNNITNKILSFSNTKRKLEEETEEELNKINELMKKKENREIFLTKINEFRNLGLFLIPEKNYYEIGKIMNSILDNILEDEDLYCAKNVLILSQTYYINDENNKKKYLQLLIQTNPIFKNINFWKKYVQFSIVYEIRENIRKEIKNGFIMMNNQEQNEMKYNNIVFGQLVPIANNMIEFGLDKENVKEIIQEKFETYRISEDLRKTILDIIEK